MSRQRFTAADGTSVGFRTFGSDRAVRALICHPGGPGLSGACFGDLCGMGSRRLRIVMIDPRGSAHSERSPDGDYSLERYASDIDALRRHLGLERFDLLGHGIGGVVAQRYAIAHSDHLDHLVLAHSAARFSSQLRDEAVAAHARHRAEPWFADAMDARIRRREIGYANPEEASALFRQEVRLWFIADAPYRRLLEWVDGETPDVEVVRYFDQHIAEDFDTRDELTRIRVPTLILVGEADWIGPRISAIELSEIPESRMHLMPGCAHWSFIETPDLFVEELEEFLELT